MSPIAVSLGDPAGIGPEIIAKAWGARELHGLHPFFVVGAAHAVKAVWDGPVIAITEPHEATAAFPHALPVINLGNNENARPGKPSQTGAQSSLQSLELATGIVRAGDACALVTGPVSKSQLYDIGFTHPGQTEFVAERCGISWQNAVMMLTGRDLRVVPVTVHIPLSKVASTLSSAMIVNKARIAVRALCKDFGIENPRLAVAGLNPHSGENGAMGDEEARIIAPAIAELLAEGWQVEGPVPPDALFTPRTREKYDAAICMYHDQALIPLKALHFDEGVNITLGLPIVRTSPDHGTAFAIAGKDQADPGAMIAAIKMASSAAHYRSLAE